MPTFAKPFLWLNVLLFGAFGLLFLTAPELFATLITQTAPATTDGMIDLRATYGGMAIGISVLLGILAKQQQFKLGLLGCAVIISGIAGGRIIGMLVDGDAGPLMWAFLAVELLFILTSAHLLKRL